MKLSSIANLISGSLSPSDYSSEISAELARHSLGLGSGGSAPVAVNEDIDLVLDPQGLGALCRIFASGQLSASELAYTADALQLSDRVEFAGELVADHLAECTDPEINGPLTIARALEITGYGSAA